MRARGEGARGSRGAERARGGRPICAARLARVPTSWSPPPNLCLLFAHSLTRCAFSTSLSLSQGYFIQGWFKFGGVEFFKINITSAIGEEAAWNSKTSIYLLASAMAEFIADIFLCPYEACRIRLVSQPDYADSLMGVAKRMSSEMGFVGAFYSGFVPILFKQVNEECARTQTFAAPPRERPRFIASKNRNLTTFAVFLLYTQVPYTMAKFAVQGKAQDIIFGSLGGAPKSETGKIGVSLGSGVIAGVVAAIISHPADTLLSKMNKGGAGGEGGMFTRMGNIVAETGVVKLCTQGLGARCIMIGTLTAGQFGIFDIVMGAVGASKFHFHDPKAKH